MEIDKLKEEIDFKWRVQTANSYGANCVAFIDARDVQDKLDEVCGAENWEAKYSEQKGNLFCTIYIYCKSVDGHHWVGKSDCGTESNVEKQKGEASDAFKRAAVMWGIGRFLYSKKIVRLKTKENPKKAGQWLPVDNGNFVYGAEEITRLCNESFKAPKPSAKAKPKKESKPAMTQAIFDIAVFGSKDDIELALKTYRISPESELALNKALKAYG